MESVIIDKENLINKIDNIINELQEVKKEITLDKIADELTLVEDVKLDTKHKESTKTLVAKPKVKEDLNKGYKDFYDINSRPNIHI